MKFLLSVRRIRILKKLISPSAADPEGGIFKLRANLDTSPAFIPLSIRSSAASIKVILFLIGCALKTPGKVVWAPVAPGISSVVSPVKLTVKLV